MSLTFSDLQTICSDYLDDPNNGYFTLPILKQRLNLNLKELQKRLISANKDYYVECVYTNTVVNQKAYQLPSDFLQVVRLSYITQGSGTTAAEQKILPITPNQRDNLVDLSGDPIAYWIQKGSASNTVGNLMLAPTPNRIVEMHLEYSYLVADMVNQSDIPDAPAQFHEYIALMTVRDLMIKDARPIMSIEGKLKEYEMLLKQIAVQRRIDQPRMIVSTDTWDAGF